MTSKPVEQAIVINILTNILRSKSNKEMKLGQLIEYNIRNIFLEKSYPSCNGEIIIRSFPKKIKIEDISGSIV